MTTFISRQSWTGKEKNISSYWRRWVSFGPCSYDTHTWARNVSLCRAVALWLWGMKSGFPSPPLIFLPRSLYLSSRPGLFHFLLALLLYKTWKMFSLAFAIMWRWYLWRTGMGWGCYQVEGMLGEIVSPAFHCWEGWIQSHKSPLAPMWRLSVISFL